MSCQMSCASNIIVWAKILTYLNTLRKRDSTLKLLAVGTDENDACGQVEIRLGDGCHIVEKNACLVQRSRGVVGLVTRNLVYDRKK